MRYAPEQFACEDKTFVYGVISLRVEDLSGAVCSLIGLTRVDERARYAINPTNFDDLMS